MSFRKQRQTKKTITPKNDKSRNTKNNNNNSYNHSSNINDVNNDENIKYKYIDTLSEDEENSINEAYETILEIEENSKTSNIEPNYTIDYKKMYFGDQNEKYTNLSSIHLIFRENTAPFKGLQITSDEKRHYDFKLYKSIPKNTKVYLRYEKTGKIFVVDESLRSEKNKRFLLVSSQLKNICLTIEANTGYIHIESVSHLYKNDVFDINAYYYY